MLRARWAAILVGTMVVGCTLTGQSSPSPAPAEQVSQAEVVNALASAGVEVVDDIDGQTALVQVADPSPLTLTTWQADSLRRDFASGGSVAGWQLDEFGRQAGMPDSAPPFSYIVAAWVSQYQSDASAAAGRLMGDQDWARPQAIVFPLLVLTMFVSEVARDGSATAGDDFRLVSHSSRVGRSQPGGPVAVGLAAPAAQCPLTGWIDHVLGSLFDALKVEESGTGILGILEVVWNMAVTLAQEVLTGLIELLTAQVLAAVRTTIAVIGVLSYAATLLTGYEMEIAHAGGATHFAHPQEGDLTGSFSATVQPTLGDWPGYLVACASVADLELPDTSPPGKPITWSSFSNAAVDLASLTDSDSALDGSGTATASYLTSREAPIEGPTSTKEGTFRVFLHVKMFSDAELEAWFEQVIFSGTAGAILKALLGGLFEEAQAQIQEVMEQDGDGLVRISWHEPEPTESPASPPVSFIVPPTDPADFTDPTASPALGGGPASAFITGAHTPVLSGGNCDVFHVQDEFGEFHQWQITFGPIDGVPGDFFDLFLVSKSPIGPGTYTDVTNQASTIRQGDFWHNIRIEQLTLEAEGDDLTQASGFFSGTYHDFDADEDWFISGVFDCNGQFVELDYVLGGVLRAVAQQVLPDLAPGYFVRIDAYSGPDGEDPGGFVSIEYANESDPFFSRTMEPWAKVVCLDVEGDAAGLGAITIRPEGDIPVGTFLFVGAVENPGGGGNREDAFGVVGDANSCAPDRLPRTADPNFGWVVHDEP